MASYRKIKSKTGVKHQVSVRIKGRQATKSFLTKIEAQSWAVEKEKEFGRGNDIVHGKTVSDAFGRYAREVSPSKKGARWEIIRLNKLKRHRLADIPLNILVTNDIREWMDDAGKTISDASVLRELQIISAVFERSRREWRWIKDNPCKDVRKPKKAPPRDRRISDDEIDRILLSLGYDETEPVVNQRHYIAIAFLLALETAMRQGEIWGLTWDYIYLDKGYLTLPDTKNGYKRDVPLSLSAIKILKRIPRVRTH